jgi:hypothetical protein
MKIKDIKVWGTVQEGRVLPVASPTGATASIESDHGDASRLAAGGGGAAIDDLFAQLVTEHLTRVLGHGH